MTAPVRRLLKLMKRDELKELCRRLGISPAGKAPELSTRLRSKLVRDQDGDEEDAARKLLEESDVSVDDWRERLFLATGQKPGRSYDALVDFVVQWAEGLLDDEEDDEEFQVPASVYMPVGGPPSAAGARFSVPYPLPVAPFAPAPFAPAAPSQARPRAASPNLLLVPTTGPHPAELKDYQRPAVHALAQLSPHDPSRRGGILCLPTGAGKTKTAVWWAMEHVIARGGRVLWLAARQELVNQAHDTFVQHAPLVRHAKPTGLRVRSIVAGSEDGYDGDVVVASVQTLQRRVSSGHNPLADIAAIIFDEAHHAPAPTFAELLRDLGCESRLLVGLSATPTRTAESERPALKRLFPAGVVFQVPYEVLMHQRYLAKPIQHVVSIDGDDTIVLDAEELAHVSLWHDLPQSALSRLAGSEKRLRAIADYIARRKDELKPMLVFAINQPHAEKLQAALYQRGVKSACVLDRTANRGQLVDALRTQQLEALVNVQVLTEGTDVPALNGVVITRPTMSRALYQQMVGRGSRGPKLGGTEKFFVVDFTANLSQFGDLLAYRYALEAELPREVFAAPEALRPVPSAPEAGMSPEVRAALDAALSDLRSADPGTSDMPVAGWYTFSTGPHGVERVEEMLVFEPDRSAVASAVRQLETRNLRAMTEEQGQEATFGIWNRELFARAVSLRKFLALGDALRMSRSVTYVSASTLLDVPAIPDDFDVNDTFSGDAQPIARVTSLPLWLAAHFERGGILTIDWDGAMRLGIERVGPGLVGLLGGFATPPDEREVYRVDVERQRDGDHDVLTLVARVDESRHQAHVREVVVKIPDSESSRFTDVIVRLAAGGEQLVAGEVRRARPLGDMG